MLQEGSIGGWYPEFSGDASHALWLDEPLVTGLKTNPEKSAGIVIIGSGLSGVSAAYWLAERGIDDIMMLDWRPADAATNRNCGHILYGTVESAAALVALKGFDVAKRAINLSVDLCHDVRRTIETLGVDCDYRQDGYLVMAVNEAEVAEVATTVELLERMGIENRLVSRDELLAMGYRQVLGGRFEPGSARAHPVKFRNALVKKVVEQGTAYYSEVRVRAVQGDAGGVQIFWDRGEGTTLQELRAEAVVIAANAYSPLFSEFFSSRRLVEPFRGQIIASAPLQHHFAHTGAQSFDHGYEYALVTPDNRLVIGGWRNHTPGGEVGTYDITVNQSVDMGLREFTKAHYDLDGEEPIWTHSWSGIMAASSTGFPFIGPTTSDRVFALAGYTGHGFSWAHGSARILADIMAGTGEWDAETLALFRPVR